MAISPLPAMASNLKQSYKPPSYLYNKSIMEPEEKNKPEFRARNIFTPREIPAGDAVPSTPFEDLRAELDSAKKLLAQEKEKSLIADLKARQQEAVSAKVESSLKDISSEMRRSVREKEVEQDRAELKEKLKELEKRLVMERETWVEIMRSQILTSVSAPASAPPAGDAKISQIEKRLDEEKDRARKTEKDANDRIARLENGLLDALREKEEAKRELSSIKESLIRLEEQGKYLDKVSSVIVSIAANAGAPRAGVAAGAVPAPPLADGEKEKLLSELSVLKQNLLRIQAANSALEREFASVKLEKEEIQRKANLQETLIDRLRAQISQYEREIASIKKRWKDSSLGASDIKTEVQQTQGRHTARVRELEKLLEFQAQEYLQRIAALEKERTSAEVKAKQLEQEKTRTDEQYKKLAELEKSVGALDEERRKFSAQKAALAKEIELLKTEKDENLKKFRDVSKEAEAARAQKLRLDAVLADFKARADKSASAMADLNKQISALEEKNKSLENEVDMQRQTLKREMDRIAHSHNELELQRQALKQEAERAAKFAAEIENKNRKTEMRRQEAEALQAEIDKRKAEIEGRLETATADIDKKSVEIENAKQALLLREEELKKRRAQTDLEMQRSAKAQAECAYHQAVLKAEIEKTSRMQDNFARKKAAFEAEIAKSAQIQNRLWDLLSKETAASAELQKKVDRFEAMTKNFFERAKWTLFGKFRE